MKKMVGFLATSVSLLPVIISQEVNGLLENSVCIGLRMPRSLPSMQYFLEYLAKGRVQIWQ